MNKGDKIIWDSGFGFEIGEYEEASQYYEDFVVKVSIGRISVCAYEIQPLTEENLQKIKNKYHKL